MATTAERLKQIMRERGLRQVDVLELTKPYSERFLVKINKSDLSQYVSGKTTPGQWKLTILGLALNVNEGWLMGLDVPKERTATIMPTREEDDVNVLHFKEEQDPQIMAAETVNSGSVSEEEADAVTFTTDSFSVYGVVTTTIEKTILASDGHMYRVTVTCGTAAGIPRRAELSVREILPESASGEADPEYEEYTAMAGSTLGFSKAEYYRLFDISIVDQEDPSVRFQPKENVDVRIELLDAGDSPEALCGRGTGAAGSIYGRKYRELQHRRFLRLRHCPRSGSGGQRMDQSLFPR